MEKQRILFLCTGNSCRSQMAEGLARELKGDLYEVHSAGIETHGLNPYAVKAMAEIGIDISGHKSELLADKMTMKFDHVITVCDHARESCPLFPGETNRVHRSFPDPPFLAKSIEGEEEKMVPYREVRNMIKDFILTFPEGLKDEE
ncbi:MAG: arsenate reductase ArsC [Spirochaetales bacterium]|nr:arsenate reductase ArsC [Spirochaetales bacterium]